MQNLISPQEIKENSPLLSSVEKGRLGVFHLKRFWQKNLLRRNGKMVPESENEWVLDKILLFGLELALEETYQYLLQNAPDFDKFENWILDINGGEIEKNRIERINATLRNLPYDEQILDELEKIENFPNVLSAEDMAFWHANGYVIVREAISKSEAAKSAEAVWNYLEMSPENPSSWYDRTKLQGIMVQSFHHDTFRRNRRSKRLQKAFAQIWETADLWTTIDRVGFNPPEKVGVWQFPGPRLHWDMSLERPLYFGTQGILYLTDVTAEQGAFTCVPGFHQRIEDWLDSLPPETDPRQENLEALGACAIAANAGDLIIWHQALPHGSSPNRARFPRIVQYINMFPNRRDDNSVWK